MIYKTKAYTLMQTICDLARIEKEIAVVMGDAGVGKTTAAQAYAEKYAGEGVVLITANSVYSTRALLTDLADELGIEHSRYRMSSEILKSRYRSSWMRRISFGRGRWRCSGRCMTGPGAASCWWDCRGCSCISCAARI
jgi:DNA transposition AAA+ family ATPase